VSDDTTSDRAGDPGAGGAAGSPGGGGDNAGGDKAGPERADGDKAGPADRSGGGPKPDGVTSGGQAIKEGRRPQYIVENLQRSEHLLGDQFDVKIDLGGGEKKIRLNLLSTRLAEEVRNAFVRPKGWSDLHDRFRRQNILLLLGPSSSGRTATAVRLLQAAQAATIWRLDPEVDFAELADQLRDERSRPDRLRPDACFLVREPSGVGRLTSSILHGLQEELGATRRLVVTMSSVESIVDDEVQRHVVSLPPAPSLFEIFQSHLRWRLGADTRADELLANEAVRALVDECLTQNGSGTAAAQLAETLFWEPEDEFDIDRVRRRLVRRPVDPFALWFDGLADVETRTFAIALAALDGLPYADVARAAAMLGRRLERTQRVALAPTEDDPTRVANERLLRRLDAETFDDDVLLALGRVPVTAVRYRSKTVAHQVLERAWHGYRMQEVLLAWLRELADDTSERVRASSCTALGAVATFSFERVWHDVLDDADEGLAGDDQPHRREAAAVVVAAVATKEELRPVARRLTNRWRLGDDAKRQATAARVHGLARGPWDRGTTLEILGRLATVDNIHVAVAVGQALVDLIVADREQSLSEIYPAVLAWLDDHKRAPTSHVAFIVMAANILTYVDGADGAPPTVWPTLLDFATQHAHLREPLVRLWHRVLDESASVQGATAKEAEEVLTGWASRAEIDDDILDAFCRMVRAVAAHGPRTRATVLRMARHWVDPYELAPLHKAASAVTAAIG
jgi:hypothetical protein